MATTSYALALGCNRMGRHGRPAQTIAAAVAVLSAKGLQVMQVSPVIATPAFGPAGRSFANAAMVVETALDPPGLLDLLKRVERDFGRRPGRRWGARILDLDIVLWSEGGWPRAPRRALPGRLTVPHRALRTRAFVLDPLVRIASRWRVPPDGHSVAQLRHRLRTRRG